MKIESKIWLWALLSMIPGFTGCLVRRTFVKRKGVKLMVWNGVLIEYLENLEVGDNVSINRGSVLNCGGGLVIGNNVLVGPRVIIYSQNHNYKRKCLLVRQQGYTKKPVIIEDDVWIAADAKIMPGTTVKKGSVIAAGAVLTKSTDEYGIYAGVPAVKIGERN